MSKEDKPQKVPLTPTRAPRPNNNFSQPRSSVAFDLEGDRSPHHQLLTLGKSVGSLPTTMVQKQYWTVEED